MNTKPQLTRALTLFPATALNMVDMIGVGPFITLPLMVTAMGGSQAIYGWAAGAALAIHTVALVTDWALLTVHERRLRQRHRRGCSCWQ